MMSSDASTEEAPLDVLLRNREAFLSFLERRIGDRALAEDILQDAFIKVIARPDAREALRKRVTQACGVCAEHGCVDCTCRPPR